MNKESESQNRTAGKSAPNAWAWIGAALAVVLSSFIAFCCTCFPVGLAVVEFGGGLIIHNDQEQIERSNELLKFAFAAGGVAAIVSGFVVIRFFRKSWSNQ